MAALSKYFGDHSGDLKIYVGSWWVGSGSFGAFSDSNAKFSGSYDFLGQNGSFAIEITLVDNKPKDDSGKCAIVLNNETDGAASYQTDDQTLTVTTKLNSAPINIFPKQGGTQIQNLSGHDVWIGHWG